MSNEYDYDLFVLGGGMAGLPVAMKCAYSDMETALVEEDLLGGTCFIFGCIPTKTMLRSAEVATLARRSEEFDGDIAEDVRTDDDLGGPFAGGSFDDLFGEIRDRNTYVNVHTVAHGGGEIRGQIH